MTADSLTVAHYRQQTALADATTKVVERLFAALFDEKSLTPSWDRLEPLLIALVQQRHRISAGVAANYFSAFRAALETPGRFVTPVEPLLIADDIVPWLRAAGPRTAIDLFNAGRAAEVARITTDSVSGSVTRMVLDGGRNTITGAIAKDPQAQGYYRAARAGCCSFCAMLASRRYQSATTATRTAEGKKYHAHCHCTPVPVFSSSQPLPPNGDRFKTLWNESTRGLHGDEARIAFRQAVEGRAA